MSSEECSFFNRVPKTRCMSPQLFRESYNPDDYTLRIVEPEIVQESLGFNPGQRFPWKSPDSWEPDGQPFPCSTPDWYIPPVFDMFLISGNFASGGDALHNEQSGYISDSGWDRENIQHWKKKMLSKFNSEM
ncbi:uncharacterized protein LOC132953062 [Metopolophium dirhodum]|uniref:uncharacterized protein LOC132953062 n=1 Tax=Metopolophium dirhodum TaxID=44670 RepID=UPI00299039BC|nr:uncharacterized protein LOC132953062 [Metopolophium dirhodum]